MPHDLVVVGGGTAGMAAARAARARGASVALVADGPLGGDCTWVGCVPSKTLIEAAAAGLDGRAALARVRATVLEVAATEDAGVLRAEGIDVVEGRAVLEGPGGGRGGGHGGPGGDGPGAGGPGGDGRGHGGPGGGGRRGGGGAARLLVDGRPLPWRRLVLATGGRPVVPDVDGIGNVGALTNETVFELPDAPASMVVLGGGPLGLELAQAFARLGTAVTVVEHAGRVLAGEESAASAVVAAALAADGVVLRTGRRLTSVARRPGGLTAVLDDATTVDAEYLLVAAGRTPDRSTFAHVDALGREELVDDHLRTAVPGVYAAGDVTGRCPHTHAADEMGRIAAANALSRFPLRRFSAAAIPVVTYTAPEVARVGMQEAEAARSVPGARVAEVPMTAVDRAVTAGRTEGYLKLVVGPRRLTRDLAGGRLLGATIVAAHAGEMIATPTLALRSGMWPARLALTVQAYPTWSLAVRQAAGQLFTEVQGRRARPARA